MNISKAMNHLAGDDAMRSEMSNESLRLSKKLTIAQYYLNFSKIVMEQLNE